MSQESLTAGITVFGRLRISVDISWITTGVTFSFKILKQNNLPVIHDSVGGECIESDIDGP